MQLTYFSDRSSLNYTQFMQEIILLERYSVTIIINRTWSLFSLLGDQAGEVVVDADDWILWARLGQNAASEQPKCSWHCKTLKSLKT